MTMLVTDEGAKGRRLVYGLLIVLATGNMLGRLATVRSSRGGTPMLSANDRSRWSTIRALIDKGTYAIDSVIFHSTGRRDPEWDSIDKVLHRGPDGRQHFYSSKPTLLTTLFAAPYGVLRYTTGLTLARHPFHVIRISLILLNIVPLVFYFLLVARFAERYGQTNWGRQFLVAAAAFATPVTTFAVTLNNHTPAAVFVLAGACAGLAIWRKVRASSWLYAAAGLCGAMAAACELPALSFAALLAVLLFWKSPWQTIFAFVPPALLVVAGVFGTNYAAHGTWSTPYAHRSDGPIIARLENVAESDLRVGLLPDSLRQRLLEAGIDVSPKTQLTVRPLNKGYAVFDWQNERQYALQVTETGLVVREWDDWYEFKGSYWSSGRAQGVDRGEPSKTTYAFHVLLGHHGLLSLTPLWLLTIVGVGIWSIHGDPTCRGLALCCALLTLVCLTFFIALRPMHDRNYGGVSCCFRWAVWLIPLWLMCLLPALDAIATRPWLRWAALLMLLVGVASATYNGQNPWSHPWLFDYWTHLGWIGYR